MNPTRPDIPSEGAPIPAVGTPGTLYLAGPPDISIEPLIQILQKAGLGDQAGDSQRQSVQWHALSGSELLSNPTQVQARPDAHLLLFFQSPETVLAEAMAAGQSPDEALSEWLQTTDRLLALVRQNRRRTTLVEMTLALEDPNTLIERLNQRLSLALSSGKSKKASQETSLDPINLLIAHNAVMSHAQARRLVSEIHATAIPVGEYESLLPDALSAWDVYQSKVGMLESEKKQLDETRGLDEPEQLKELKEENDLLLLQLHQVQEELETYYLKGRDADKKYGRLEAEKKKLEKEVIAVRRRADVLSQKIDGMRQSKSWKLTKPLRIFTKLFKRNRNKQN